MDLQLSHSNADVSGIAADVSNAEGCATLTKALPTVDMLVNNVGIFEPTPSRPFPTKTGCAFLKRM